MKPVDQLYNNGWYRYVLSMVMRCRDMIFFLDQMFKLSFICVSTVLTLTILSPALLVYGQGQRPRAIPSRHTRTAASRRRVKTRLHLKAWYTWCASCSLNQLYNTHTDPFCMCLFASPVNPIPRAKRTRTICVVRKQHKPRWHDDKKEQPNSNAPGAANA